MGVTQLTKQALVDAYGLHVLELRRIHAGLATINMVATVAGGDRLFVKVYRRGADLDAARAAIELTRYANAGGVPTALPLCDARGATVHAGLGFGLSAWTFVDGDCGDTVGLDAARMRSLGEVLGHLHDRLATYRRAEPGVRWCDLVRSRASITAMIDQVLQAPHLDRATRVWGAGVLRWRLARLPQVDEIVAGLPEPAVQVVHGDLHPGNVIFRGERVAALIDFEPPAVRQVLWEIARAACSQYAVLHDGRWPQRLGCLLRAYRSCNSRVPAGVLAAVPWLARCVMTASVTPFDDLVEGRAAHLAAGDPLSVPALVRYAHARQEAVARLWEYSDDDDQALRQVLGCRASR
ncbi:phosphotransferase enzyme family protein [Paractinoplanes rishiriensis]|uniref:phosphotransferase enzyme family protein n=1 Tax=Paractinoplanes rishiriensis TaxID=1050105 RepID=UPI0019419ED7|nr:phosphotransferase [Actinoplanes rishiriensis]